MTLINSYQEPIKWSLYLPYNPLACVAWRFWLGALSNIKAGEGRETARRLGRKPTVGRANHNDVMTLLLYFIKQQEIRC